MNFDLLRHNMVTQQLVRRGIDDSRVLAAMERVPRELFVPIELRDRAHDDCALPIGWEQTISQPFTVAFMCQEARLLGHETVLEVGTGSGYAAAVLAELAQIVHSIERVDPLYHLSTERLAAVGYQNVRTYLGDGSLGLPAEAPFDAIIVAAGAAELPRAYLDQLAEGGRLVIPIGPDGHQRMCRITRSGDTWDQEDLGSFGFVPLVSGDDER